MLALHEQGILLSRQLLVWAATLTVESSKLQGNELRKAMVAQNHKIRHVWKRGRRAREKKDL